MKTIKDVLRHIYEESHDVTISLMVTEFCNFECAHCFYGCSSRNKRAYITDAMLNKVKAAIDDLNDFDINVNVNIVGGEPTWNFKEFKRVWDKVLSWRNYPAVGVEMTTNGWWLHKASTATKFFEIVAPDALYGGAGIEEGLTIRISEDEYHRANRPSHFRNSTMKMRLNEIFDSGTLDGEPVTERVTGYCNNCDHTPRDPWREDCPKCHAEDTIYQEYESIISLPENNANYPWIYVEEDKGGASGVIPSGVRGQFGQNVFQYGERGLGFLTCLFENKLTFLPNGKHTDGCCRGSLMPTGTVEDHPLVLLALNWNGLEHIQPNCWNCREQFALWSEGNMIEDRRSRLYKELEWLQLDDNWRKIEDAVTYQDEPDINDIAIYLDVQE